MEVSDLFAVGKIFGNVEEVKSAVQEYNEQNYTEFIVETNNKNSLILVCKYERIRASKSQGIRKNLQYNNLNCKACIALNKSKKYGNLKVPQVSLEHNHLVDNISHDLQNTNLSTEDLEMVKD